ncbi:hypothetical protein CHH28_13945 [Bacterioplanes sanyensis]|uniref:Low-complexity protein n=1 Tax=Bacterioplanes sanyensis TaxID=1249553 RepID=A0A222FL19_9GAMM|nr:hypothetical protein [Bacterioplanes sanyensis]ASP39708.1 hypothetical protein CHH28_13945 [Bacterioplanes sanyensis]
MANNSKKPAAAVLSAAFLAALATTPAQASDANPFASQTLDGGYQLAGDHEGKCGEGKCGGKADSEGKCGEGKCGGKADSEGKCGGKSDSEGKCGEGKCGGNS